MSRTVATIVRIELFAVLAFDLALLLAAPLALVCFLAVGVLTMAPVAPVPEEGLAGRVTTPIGLLLMAAVLGLPAIFLLLAGLLLHRFVAAPLARRLADELSRPLP